MELKVWVEGIQRIVCGVTENTTCQDVVFALAHATGKVGRFTLIERWRNNERLLAPQEYPLKILMKWGEYSNDIQFILRRSDTGRDNQKSQSQNLKATSTCIQNASNPNILENSSPSQSNAPLNSTSNMCHKNNSSSTSSNNTSPGNPVGVVKGVQQTRHIDSNSPLIKDTPPLKDVPPYREPPPPYRSPPPPQSRKSPSRGRAHASPVSVEPSDKAPEAVCYNSQYRELVSLVNYQREKLSSQQADLIKYDAEIGYWESKGREQERQAEIIQHQINTADTQLKAATEQVQSLAHVEQESEACAHKEQALRAEVALFRSKLASCEAELQQCRHRMRKLLDEVQLEQRAAAAARHHDSRQNVERSMLAEMENLQSQIQQAKHATEVNHLTAETLKREVGALEAAILEKKRQVERLVQQMKEANLQSLADSADDLRHPLDGSYKSGSARRIIGSPRQLENAAPTNKNPHGVWV